MVNVPVAAMAIVGEILFVPTSRDPAAPKVDVPGLILSSIGVTALIYTVIDSPQWGRVARGRWHFGIATIVLAAFARWKWRSSHPMLESLCSRTGDSPVGVWR